MEFSKGKDFTNQENLVALDTQKVFTEGAPIVKEVFDDVPIVIQHGEGSEKVVRHDK